MGLSHRDSLSQYPLTNSRFEAAFGYNVHGTSEQNLQLELQPPKIQQRSAGFEFDQEVQVALRVRFSPRDGTENPHVAGTMRAGEFAGFPAGSVRATFRIS